LFDNGLLQLRNLAKNLVKDLARNWLGGFALADFWFMPVWFVPDPVPGFVPDVPPKISH
jgi:hypothetical protein